MKLSFKSLMGSIPKGGRAADQVTAAGVSVKKKDRQSLSTSDKLKLSRTAREGGMDKLCFFETDGMTVGDVQTIYDLNMRIEALSVISILRHARRLSDNSSHHHHPHRR